MLKCMFLQALNVCVTCARAALFDEKEHQLAAKRHCMIPVRAHDLVCHRFVIPQMIHSRQKHWALIFDPLMGFKESCTPAASLHSELVKVL